MEVSPTRAEHVIASLGDAVDVVLDAGPTTVGIESTVIALRDGQARILRPGTIPRSAIAEIVPIAEETDDAATGDTPRPSPGMLDRHYAPRAQVVVTDDAPGIADRLRREGRRVGVLSLPPDPDLYARGLYATLRAMDDEGLDVIVVPSVPLDERWEGVRDRLSRASREL
jgi:L-threonylcarbamoyladenylate synthase